MRAVVAISCTLGAVALGGAASPAAACACDPASGPVVATGTSPRGVPWRVRAARNGPSRALVDFALAPPGYEDAGYGMELPYPLPKRFPFTAQAGEDLDPYGERDVSGVAARRVVRIVIRLSDDSTGEPTGAR